MYPGYTIWTFKFVSFYTFLYSFSASGIHLYAIFFTFDSHLRVSVHVSMSCLELVYFTFVLTFISHACSVLTFSARTLYFWEPLECSTCWAQLLVRERRADQAAPVMGVLRAEGSDAKDQLGPAMLILHGKQILYMDELPI